MDSTSTLTPQDDATPPSVPFPDPTTSTPATAPVAATSACSNCGAALAADQRYCLVCGERNGDPRLPVMGGRDTLSSPATPAAVTTTTRGPRGGGSTNTALIAGVGTLLVALGVGVVIGRSSDNNNSTAKAPQVITVGAPAAAAAGGAAVAGSSATPGDTSGAAAATAGARAARAKSSGDRAKAKADAARTATPGNGKVAARRGTVVRLGQRGSGKGYKDGKFTGDFFGG